LLEIVEKTKCKEYNLDQAALAQRRIGVSKASIIWPILD
jgi:hypothetical protein